jgi:competence protein ComEA
MNGSPELPPRPQPPKRLGESLNAWLAWFGIGRLVVSAVCVVAVAAGGAWLLRTPAPTTEAGIPFVGSTASRPTTPTLAPPTTPPTSVVAEPPSTAPVFVHVAGSVRTPGLYEVAAPARVHDAVEAAGGPTGAADLDGLNLAAPVTDGQRVYVPAAGEVDPASVPQGGDGDGAAASEPVPSVGPIDLNVATVEQLETLPGIGPATASAIVDDRDRHGPFATVADLERVPGIGPAKLAAVIDLVTV